MQLLLHPRSGVTLPPCFVLEHNCLRTHTYTPVRQQHRRPKDRPHLADVLSAPHCVGTCGTVAKIGSALQPPRVSKLRSWRRDDSSVAPPTPAISSTLSSLHASFNLPFLSIFLSLSSHSLFPLSSPLPLAWRPRVYDHPKSEYHVSQTG